MDLLRPAQICSGGFFITWSMQHCQRVLQHHLYPRFSIHKRIYKLLCISLRITSSRHTIYPSVNHMTKLRKNLLIHMPKSKSFYAVHRGHKTGIYTSWGECSQQVNGFPGAQYKKFACKNEAQAFMQHGKCNSAPGRKKRPQSAASQSLNGFVNIYTDGSSRGNGKQGARAGVGVFFGKNDHR